MSVSDTAKINIRHTTNKDGQSVLVAEDLLLAILATLKGIQDDIRELILVMKYEDLEDDGT